MLDEKVFIIRDAALKAIKKLSEILGNKWL